MSLFFASPWAVLPFDAYNVVVLAVLLDTSPIRCPDRIVANYTDPNPNDQSSNLPIQSNLRTLSGLIVVHRFPY